VVQKGYLDKRQVSELGVPNDQIVHSTDNYWLGVTFMNKDESAESAPAQPASSPLPADGVLELKIVAIGDHATGPIDSIQFQRLAIPDRRVPSPPRFIFGTFPESISNHFFGLWGIPSVGVFVCRDVKLIGEFLVARGDQAFRSSELNIHPAHIETLLTKYSPISAGLGAKRISGRHVCLAGPGYGVYGHWLVEYLPKLGVLHSAGYDVKTLSYLIPRSVPRFAVDWLRLLGIKESQLNFYDSEKEFLSVEELLLPTVLHNGNRMSPLFRDAANLLKELVATHGGQVKSASAATRIFVSRKRFSRARALTNRDRIEGMAINAGFKLVYPEELPLLDQVTLFSNAQQIIGEYGSGLHGSMFSKPGTIVCALRGSALHPGFIQSGLGEVMEQPTGYVMGQTNGSDPNATFTVSEEAFEACLRLIFNGLPL
jgi:capsular polysaccharide biosynthesis protein